MNKKIIFLGSSVTYGSAAGGRSFVELLAEKYGFTAVKEAVSGTTLADIGEDSYVARMKKIKSGGKVDAFICQLSTNDASLKLPVGAVSAAAEKERFDTQTIAGAIEYIIAYAREKWDCPVCFYTGTRYNSREYGTLVTLLSEIKEKWHIDVIDLWNSDMNDIPPEEYSRFMADPIHPTAAGYREWWLPHFEEYITEKI